MFVSQVTPKYFARLFDMARFKDARIKASTSPFEPSRSATYVVFESADPRETAGYVIRRDGELTNVWSRKRGFGDYLIEHAIANGATHLDCFDGYLVEFYSRHGFVETKREPNWTVGEPDIVFMSL